MLPFKGTLLSTFNITDFFFCETQDNFFLNAFFVHTIKVNVAQCYLDLNIFFKKDIHTGFERQEGEKIMTGFSFSAEQTLEYTNIYILFSST